MGKIILKYTALLIPITAMIIFLTYSEKEPANASALEEVVASEYIMDLSESSNAKAQNWGDNKEGSAKYLSGRTGIVTFFVGDAGSEWTTSDITTVCDKLNVAAGYLMESGRKYHQNVDLVYNMPDMMFYEQFDRPLKEWESVNYTRQVYNWIDKDVNCEYLLSKYDLDGLAFLCVLNKDGISYAVVHDVEDEKTNYYEVAYIYLFDAEYPDRYESPAAYAHELLHLFGAVDLYNYENNPVSYGLEAYIRTKHPNELMYTTYHDGHYSLSNQIEQEFSDITAYSVGFLSECDEVNQFPELKKQYPACFSSADGQKAITFEDGEKGGIRTK